MALVIACLVLPLAGVLLVRPGAGSLVGAAAATGLIVHPIVLTSAVLIYLHWRLSGGRLARWFTVSLVVLSAPGLTLAGVNAADPAAADRGPWWPLVTLVLATSVLLAVTVVSTRFRIRVDPLVAGVLAGLVLSALGLVLVTWAPEPRVPSFVTTGLSLVPPLIAVAIARVVLRRPRLPFWGRLQLSLGLVLLTVGETSPYFPLSRGPGGAVTLVAAIVGTALLTTTALALVRMSIRDTGVELADLHERLISVESAVRKHRARMHEIGSTVAGITSASRLINEPTVVLARHRRALLTEMIEAELSRLERLMTNELDTVRVFDVDDVLRQLVVAQHAQGRLVHWEPSGCRALGRPDDLAEVVHVLLDNAAKHGRNAGATVEVHELDGVIEISVSDLGPGIAPDVRHRIFDWESRSRTSSGQGIGLTIARDLVEQHGGYLLLKETPQPGTTFTVGLLVGEKDDAVGHRTG